MKVALVHDWLTGMRGGERCLEAFLRMYPEADIFTLIHEPGSTSRLIDDRVKATSFLQQFPGVRRYYRLLLPLFPRAVSKFKLEGYDLVISLSHSAVKNIEVPKGTFHICYCFTPMRYIWDQSRAYFGPATQLLWPVLNSLRAWDLEGSRRPDVFVAISRFVAARIRCFYGRNAEVIYPPVDTSWIHPAADDSKGVAFLHAGALVPYKRPELVVEAFNRLGEPLWIVGSGPMERELKRRAKSNITFFGKVPDRELANFYRKSRALVFGGVEDFGLVPIECLAAGRPVIAPYRGGLRETVKGVTHWKSGLAGAVKSAVEKEASSGVFIGRTRRSGFSGEVGALLEALNYFMAHEAEFSVDACLKRAESFSPIKFYRAWDNLLYKHGLASRGEGSAALQEVG